MLNYFLSTNMGEPENLKAPTPGSTSSSSSSSSSMSLSDGDNEIEVQLTNDLAAINAQQEVIIRLYLNNNLLIAHYLDQQQNQVTRGSSIPGHVVINRDWQNDKSIAEEVSYKNRLQQFTQRASIPLPVYKTFCEAQHPPSFRSRVWVNGTCFTSNTCPCKKMAEQEVAKLALADVIRKVKDEGSSLIREGKVTTVLCKSIMNEYAVKMNMERPTYDTVQPKGLLPVFVSSLVFNGVAFTGDTATNKKEAENFAARSAILSILGSESGTTMSEIVRSKFRLFDEFKSRKDSSMVDDSSMPIGVNPGEKLVSLNKRKEVEVNGDTVNDTFASLDPTLENPSVVQGAHLPLHEFQKPRLEPLLEATAPPIVFVPPALELSLPCSTSGKKKNRKKKKAKKKMLVDSQ